MWIQGREITLHKVTCAAEVKTAERASGWRLSASSTPNNWGHKSSTEGRSGGHIIVSTRSTLCANWFYLLINNLWATSMDSSRLVFLNEFYRGGKLVKQTSDTAAGLRGTADPHCLPTWGPELFILDTRLVTISTQSTMVSKNTYSWAQAQTPCTMRLFHQSLWPRLFKESGKRGHWDQEHAGASPPGVLCRSPSPIISPEILQDAASSWKTELAEAAVKAWFCSSQSLPGT